MSFFCFETPPPPQDTSLHSLSCLLRLLLAVTVSQAVFNDLDTFEECSSGILKNAHYWDLYDVFLRRGLELLVSGRKTHRWSAIFMTSYQRYKLPTWFMNNDVGVEHLAEVVCVMFLHCDVTRAPSILFPLEGSRCAQPTLKEWGVMSPSWECWTSVNYLEFFCMRDLILISHLLTYLIIYL